MSITVTLEGTPRDRQAVTDAVYLAAKQHQEVNVVVSAECVASLVRHYTDYPCWDLEARCNVKPPSVHVEAHVAVDCAEPFIDFSKRSTSPRQ